MRKAANRMNFDFNVAEDEYIDGDEVVGLGAINKEGSGRLRLVASQQKVNNTHVLSAWYSGLFLFFMQ
jgi:U4/U6 small nuclear ribonucleoprotein PRP31